MMNDFSKDPCRHCRGKLARGSCSGCRTCWRCTKCGRCPYGGPYAVVGVDAPRRSSGAEQVVMEGVSFSKTNAAFHIEGFPDAVKVIKLDGKLAGQLASYSLHHFDLRRSLSILESINEIDPEQYVIREALWHQAIVTYVKCFRRSEARHQLNENKIYKGEPSEALEVFRYFVSMRNKNIVHDENSYTQCLPGAVLNKRDHQYKIAKIVCLNVVGSVSGQGNYSNLHLLVAKALKWVEAEYDSLCARLTRELEADDYENLLQKEGITYSKPCIEDASKRRATL